MSGKAAQDGLNQRPFLDLFTTASSPNGPSDAKEKTIIRLQPPTRGPSLQRSKAQAQGVHGPGRIQACPKFQLAS